MTTIFKCGDMISVKCGNQVVDAQVIIASPNGRSLVINFEAILGGHVGSMPVMMKEDDTYQALLTGAPLELILKTAS